MLIGGKDEGVITEIWRVRMLKANEEIRARRVGQTRRVNVVMVGGNITCEMERKMAE